MCDISDGITYHHNHVSFLATEHHYPLDGTKFDCQVTKNNV